MALIEAIKKRYSCRTYSGKAIEEAVLSEVLEAARLAPSAKNLQDWRFVVVRDPELKKKLAIAAKEQMFLAEAGAIIVGCSAADYVMTCGQSISPIDVAIGLEHISLQAAECGLGTYWIGAFYADKVREILNIPDNVEIIDMMAIGYPAEPMREPVRKEIGEIVCYDGWSFEASAE
jgi:nitroreductase